MKSTPFFFFFFGMGLVGTGKSRLLDEFKWLALKVTIENSDLNKKIMNSYVFKVDLRKWRFVWHV